MSNGIDLEVDVYQLVRMLEKGLEGKSLTMLAGHWFLHSSKFDRYLLQMTRSYNANNGGSRVCSFLHYEEEFDLSTPYAPWVVHLV